MRVSRGLRCANRLCFLWWMGGFVANSAAQSGASSTPEANPGRPTVSTPATLTPVGYLQFENGILYALDSTEFSSRLGVNQVTKLAVHPRLQLILQSEPLVGSEIAGQHAWQAGGVSAGVQGVFLPGHETRPTISVSYLRSVYSGPAPDIDIGSANQSALILVSDDLVRVPHRRERNLQRASGGNCPAGAVRANAFGLSSAEEIHAGGRNLALHAAVPARQYNREPLGRVLYGSSQSRF